MLSMECQDSILFSSHHPKNTNRLKVVQLEELLAIRHCVFIMGPPGAGKTQCWKTLVHARKLRNNPTKVRQHEQRREQMHTVRDWLTNTPFINHRWWT
jgi:ABC-type phosphate/phosphonate transport system ATPase subunit